MLNCALKIKSTKIAHLLTDNQTNRVQKQYLNRKDKFMKFKILLFFLLAATTTNAQDLMVRAVVWGGQHGNSIPLTRAYEFTTSIRNVSPTASPAFDTYFYISEDANLDPSDTYIGMRQWSDGLGAYSTASITSNGNLPNLSSGTYWVIVKVDQYDDVNESNEYNNTYYSPFTIESRPTFWRDPRLITFTRTNNLTVIEGDDIEIFYRVGQRGSFTYSRERPIKIHFTLHRIGSLDVIDLGYDEYIPRYARTNFWTGSRTITLSVPGSFTTSSANFFIRASIDPDNDIVPDINIHNNVKDTPYFIIYDNPINNGPGRGEVRPDAGLNDESIHLLSDANVEESVSLFPNPSSEEINISLPTKTDFRLVIRDANGKVMDNLFYENTNSAKVKVSGYHKGIYLVQVAAEQMSVTKKFIRE